MLQEAFQSTSVAFIFDYPLPGPTFPTRLDSEPEPVITKLDSEPSPELDSSSIPTVDDTNKEQPDKKENVPTVDEANKEQPDKKENVQTVDDTNKEQLDSKEAPESEATVQEHSDKPSASVALSLEQKELLSAATLYHQYGQILDACTSKEVRVVVVGQYANTGAAIIARCAPSLSTAHIIAAPCRAERHARTAIASKLGLNTADVVQVWLLGGHARP